MLQSGIPFRVQALKRFSAEMMVGSATSLSEHFGTLHFYGAKHKEFEMNAVTNRGPELFQRFNVHKEIKLILILILILGPEPHFHFRPIFGTVPRFYYCITPFQIFGCQFQQNRTC